MNQRDLKCGLCRRNVGSSVLSSTFSQSRASAKSIKDAGNPEERAHAFHILIRSDSVQQLSAAAGPACALPPASTGLAKSIGWELHEHCHAFMFANLRTVFALKNVNQEIPTDPAVMQPVPALSPSHVTSHTLFYRVV